ncbi:hypothetical protein N7501_010555 [Penicillium viridicatum]|nr:hypothetical protein N7501_010555 [Penicillium viridicatum]
MSLIDNQSQREPELGTGGRPVERTVSPCVWDPLSALCIGTVCWRVCRSSAVWLSGPVIALVGSCLYFPLTFPVPLYPPLLPLPTVYVPRSAVERLYSNPRRQFRTSQLLHLSYHPLPFPNFASPVWLWCFLLIDNCLSVLHRLSPAYPTPSNLRDHFPQWMPEFKAYKVTCSSSASLM